MSSSRLPKQKYLRQLREMHTELCEWRAMYMEAAHHTTSDHLAGRFSGRAIVLEDAITQIRELLDTIYGLPRLT